MLVFWSWLTGSNRISLAIQGAHEASVFALCMLRNGTLVSGGKDRKLISWDENYQNIQTVEVRHTWISFWCSMHLYAWIVVPDSSRYPSFTICICNFQVPELYGPIRTVAEGRGETVLIGTTRNYVLQGSLDGEFIPITQVSLPVHVQHRRVK